MNNQTQEIIHGHSEDDLYRKGSFGDSSGSRRMRDGEKRLGKWGVIMGLGLQYEVIIAYAFGLILLYIIGWLLLVPLKIILKFIYNGIIGGIMLWVLNIVGGIFGITVTVNPITALIAGFLGIPGIILILLLQYFLA
jgi:inhibitor of the pro-sigma K processing machinery